MKNFDYRSRGIYHVTICTNGKRHLFGEIECGAMKPNALGNIAVRNIEAIPVHFPTVELIEWVVMPNHVHLLMALAKDADAIYGVPTATHSVGQIIGAYKASVSRDCQQAVWQPRFYDHIIRNDRDLEETIAYIQNNPLAWDKDVLNAPTP